MDQFIGQIQLFGFNFEPVGWAKCDGRILLISPHLELFSLLGTQYGGDGRTTFALPDLRGRVALGEGGGPGLSPVIIGQKGGVEQVALTLDQMPQHTHETIVHAADPIDRGAGSNTPKKSYWAKGSPYATSHNEVMASDAVKIQNTGGGKPHENRQPFIGLNYCIALVGIYPSRS